MSIATISEVVLSDAGSSSAMPDWRYNILSTSEAYLAPAEDGGFDEDPTAAPRLHPHPVTAASYPRRALRSRLPHTCPYTTIFLGTRECNPVPYQAPEQLAHNDAYGDVYSVDHSSNFTDTSSFARYEDCRLECTDDIFPIVEDQTLTSDSESQLKLHVQKVPYTSSVFYVSAKNDDVIPNDQNAASGMYIVEGGSDESDAISSCTCDSFERCEFDCRDFEPFSDTCCCDPLGDGLCARSPKDMDSPEQCCEHAMELDAVSAKSDMDGLDLALFEPACGDEHDHCERGEIEPRAVPPPETLCGVLYSIPDKENAGQLYYIVLMVLPIYLQLRAGTRQKNSNDNIKLPPVTSQKCGSSNNAPVHL